MRLDWRYVVVSVLVGVAVCSLTGAVAGLVEALGAEQPEDQGSGATLGAVVGSALAGLIIGAALGAVLGVVSGVVATLVVGDRTAPAVVSRRVAVAVGLTYLVALTLMGGFASGDGWRMPSLVQWIGVIAPTVLAALGTGRAAREVPGLP